MPEIDVGSEGISKLLKNLKTDKAVGPDQIKPLLLKELHQELSPIIQVLFQLSLSTLADSHRTGWQQMWAPCSKKVTGLNLPITVPSL